MLGKMIKNESYRLYNPCFKPLRVFSYWIQFQISLTYQSNIKYYVDNLKLFVFQSLRQFYFNILLRECNDILVLVSVAVGSVKSLYSAQNFTQYRIWIHQVIYYWTWQAKLWFWKFFFLLVTQPNMSLFQILKFYIIIKRSRIYVSVESILCQQQNARVSVMTAFCKVLCHHFVHFMHDIVNN